MRSARLPASGSTKWHQHSVVEYGIVSEIESHRRIASKRTQRTSLAGALARPKVLVHDHVVLLELELDIWIALITKTEESKPWVCAEKHKHTVSGCCCLPFSIHTNGGFFFSSPFQTSLYPPGFHSDQGIQ
jgi:hypothetical protein